MTPAQMIAEWRKGCSCADDPAHPEECQECTRGLIEAIDHWHAQSLWRKVWLLSRLRHWIMRCLLCQLFLMWVRALVWRPSGGSH